MLEIHSDKNLPNEYNLLSKIDYIPLNCNRT